MPHFLVPTSPFIYVSLLSLPSLLVSNILNADATKMNISKIIAAADAVPKEDNLNASRYKYITTVIASSLPKAVLPKNTVGSVNNCIAPTVEKKTVNKINGLSNGIVMYLSCWNMLAPSILDASYNSFGILCIPAK